MTRAPNHSLKDANRLSWCFQFSVNVVPIRSKQYDKDAEVPSQNEAAVELLICYSESLLLHCVVKKFVSMCQIIL